MTKISKEQTEKLITKKELNSVFWRSFQMEFSWNYERQMNMAYVFAMIPILKSYILKSGYGPCIETSFSFLIQLPIS